MKPYVRVTVGYFIFGMVWILVSDHVAMTLAPNTHSLAWFQTVKGACYILASSVLIWVLSWRAYRDQLAELRQREAVYRKTIEASHHILLNYLNKMQLVSLEARNTPGFDPEILKMAGVSSAEASAELRRLESIRTITTEEIDSVVYRDLRRK